MADTPMTSSVPTPSADPDRSFVVAADMLQAVTRTKREMLLAPVLPRGTLTLLHGPRGVGKTFLSLSIALAVAGGGSALCWRAPRPARVLYVDGEMPRATLLDRLAGLAAGARCMPAADHLRLLASEGRDDRPNIATRAGRETIDRSIGDGVDLVVLDSLAVLLRGQGTNLGQAWLGVEDWLLGLRGRDIAVLVVRNGSANRERQETTRHADIVDIALTLRRPVDYDQLEGARFNLIFSKGRALFGPAAQPFEAALMQRNKALYWVVSTEEKALLTRVQGLLLEDFSVREIAGRLGVSKSQAQRLCAEAIRPQETGADPDTASPGTLLESQEEFEKYFSS